MVTILLSKLLFGIVISKFTDFLRDQTKRLIEPSIRKVLVNHELDELLVLSEKVLDWVRRRQSDHQILRAQHALGSIRYGFRKNSVEKRDGDKISRYFNNNLAIEQFSNRDYCENEIVKYASDILNKIGGIADSEFLDLQDQALRLMSRYATVEADLTLYLTSCVTEHIKSGNRDVCTPEGILSTMIYPSIVEKVVCEANPLVYSQYENRNDESVVVDNFRANGKANDNDFNLNEASNYAFLSESEISNEDSTVALTLPVKFMDIDSWISSTHSIPNETISNNTISFNYSTYFLI